MGDEGYFDWRESLPRDRQSRSQRQTPDGTKMQHNLETQSPSLMCTMYGLMKDPCQPITHHRMKAQTLLMSRQNGDVRGRPSYRMRCA
ncbi:hypothetical protein CK203_030863 [Vitis vinifera]|uniref:Uncharacterized protein n=1 Tax=Vitis vinifera TaxID=29760 RepID=A0A438ID43_VITVI|nr:hypothetical protein CK203_030863 [Vitis vinifera]